MDEPTKDAIQAIVDERYATNEGPATITVRQIQWRLEERTGRAIGWNELAVTCDELVEAGRLVFLRDHGRDGRRYCSTNVPAATVELLKEPFV